MRTPKTAKCINPKKRTESPEDTPSPEPPLMEEVKRVEDVEESANGEQADQPPLIEKPAPTGVEYSATSSDAITPSRERVSALAVVSVVSSLLGFLGVTSLLGLGLGIVALRQIAANPQLSGRHLAILGVCLSVLWLVLLLAMGSVLWVGLSLVQALFNAIF